jgi:hypothetical protein
MLIKSLAAWAPALLRPFPWPPDFARIEVDAAFWHGFWRARVVLFISGKARQEQRQYDM